MEDYKTLAEDLKDQGNELFQSGDVNAAIQLYSQAIDLDPDNCVYYSNRSAAFMKADSKSKALKDAEKCIELNPLFVKGYNRLGAAQQGLKRFENAIDSFKKGIELDPNNQTLWSALVACQQAYEVDKKERFAEAEIERQREDDYQRRKEAAKERARMSALKSAEETGTTASEGAADKTVADENDLLNSFFSEVIAEPISSTTTPASAASIQTRAVPISSNTGEVDTVIAADMQLSLTEKYATQDLGKGIDQVLRLTGPNYKLKNQNPYAVLQLDIDATEEDIKNRYRKLSTRIHPDKLRDVENAREAFEQVKIAYQKLCEPDQKLTAIRNIEFVKEEVLKERKRLLAKGVKESDMPFSTYEEECSVRLMKHFADIEMQRRRSETNIRAHNARERGQEDEEKRKMVEDMEMEKQWAELDRREKRVSSWRDFQDDAAALAKKTKIASYKEDSRAESKHGVVKLNQWKKSWK